MPDPQHTDDADGRILAALMAWRQQLIDSGAVSKSGFKETHLRLILRSGRTDVDHIRAMLPGSVAEHAEDLAAVLAETLGAEGRHHRPLAAVDGGEQDVTEAGREIPPRADDFAAYTFTEQPDPLATITSKSVPDADGAAGSCQLAWPPYQPGGDAVVIYRLISEEDNAP